LPLSDYSNGFGGVGSAALDLLPLFVPLVVIDIGRKSRMAAKASLVPTFAVFTVALFLLITFFRTNIVPYHDIVQLGRKGRDSYSPRYIFVDLGANGADSLEAFLQNEGSKFQFNFPRPSWAEHNQAGELFANSALRKASNAEILARNLLV
jgi:hypothetical protein